MELTPVTQLDPFLTSAPALIALIIKVGIYWYARSAPAHNYQTRLYLLFLFALSIQNVAEIAHFYVLADGVIPALETTVYYVASMVAILLLFHLSVAVSWESWRPVLARWVYGTAYVSGLTVIGLLIASDAVVRGFESIAYTVTRIPGPYYFLFELLVFGLLGLVIVFFSIGARYGATSRDRARNKLLLVGVIPIIAIVASVLTLLHFGSKWLNASVVLPMGVTFFLMVSAYAIHRHRIFDIQFFLPWSRVRRRKNQFYDGIRRLGAELADLSSSRALVAQLSSAMRCPVALLGSDQPAHAGGAEPMLQISPAILHSIDEVVVAQEILDARPSLYRAMASHHIDAIVPFYPHNSDACGWLLLGKEFQENCYSDLDFRVVEELFERLSELFLARFARLRTELRSLQQGVQALSAENRTLKALLEQSQDRSGASGPADLLSARSEESKLLHAVRTSCENLPQSITLLGRDADMARLLRREFEDVKSYVGLASKAFRKSGQPDLLVCRVDGDGPDLADRLRAWKHSTAALLYGDGAKEFANKHAHKFAGALIDVVDSTDTVNFLKRLRALMTLHEHRFSTRNHDVPLIGSSRDFCAYMRTIQLFAQLNEPVLLYHGGDVEQFSESVHYMHRWANLPGVPLILKTAELANARLDEQGTVALVDADADVQTTRRVVADVRKVANGMARVVLGCRDHANGSKSLLDLQPGVRLSSINLPRLKERAGDISLLCHYFVLQFNIRSPISLSYGQHDIDAIVASSAISGMGALRGAIFDRLYDRAKRVIRDEAAQTPGEVCLEVNMEQSKKSLDALVRDFEARIIRQTLSRCGGNKAKTARILGLRPNTLHYKLERYGLNGTSAAQD